MIQLLYKEVVLTVQNGQCLFEDVLFASVILCCHQQIQTEFWDLVQFTENVPGNDYLQKSMKAIAAKQLNVHFIPAHHFIQIIWNRQDTMMHKKIFNEEKKRKLFFAHLCALRDNFALLINDYSRLFLGYLLSVKIVCKHNLYVPPFGR